MTICKEIKFKEESRFPIKFQVEIEIEDQSYLDKSISDLKKCDETNWVEQLREILESK